MPSQRKVAADDLLLYSLEVTGAPPATGSNFRGPSFEERSVLARAP